MLSKQTINTIAVMIGVDADVLAQTVSDEQEKDLELSEGRFLTKENELTLLDNHGKRKYDEGIKKNQKEVFNGKTKDEYLKDLTTKILEDAKIEPNQKLEVLQESFDALQNKYTSDLGLKDNEISKIASKLKGIETTSSLKSLLPTLKDGITDDVAITMFTTTHEIKEDGIYKNGQLLKNDMHSPLTKEQAFTTFITERGWKQEDVRGNGSKNPNYSGAVPKNYDEFEKYCESKSIQVGSQEANGLIEKFAKDNENFYND